MCVCNFIASVEFQVSVCAWVCTCVGLCVSVHITHRYICSLFDVLGLNLQLWFCCTVRIICCWICLSNNHGCMHVWSSTINWHWPFNSLPTFHFVFVFTHGYLRAYAYLGEVGWGGGGGGMMIADRTGGAVLIYSSCILANTVYVWWLECVKFGLDVETHNKWMEINTIWRQ